jgi:hypothetical protein
MKRPFYASPAKYAYKYEVPRSLSKHSTEIFENVAMKMNGTKLRDIYFCNCEGKELTALSAKQMAEENSCHVQGFGRTHSEHTKPELLSQAGITVLIWSSTC